MLRNYLRIAYRSLVKNKAFSFINILGLAVGMAAFQLIIHYVRFERSYEDFNPIADHVYRITLDRYNGAEYVVTDCETHAPIGPMLKEKMPEVRAFVRMFHNDGLQDIKVGTQKFLEENIYFADPSAFEIFSIDVLHGDPASALTNPMQAVLTASMAKKYFGRTDIIGEAIEIDKTVYHITSVIADMPVNTHLKFSILLSHATLGKKYEWYQEDDSWSGNNEYTYLLIEPETNLLNFNKNLALLSATLKDKIKDSRYVAEPIKSIHLHSHKTYEPEVNGNAKVVYFLAIIAAFIIMIAWVNYINLSTARSVERAREVGIRKVVGSLKSQLIFQFLSESIIVNLFAGGLAFLMFLTLFPAFRNLTGQPLPLNFISDPIFWYLFLGLFTIGSLLSGIYPAFVLSSFQPVAVLKGKFQSSTHGQLLRKGLVMFQFSTTVVLLICMLTVYLQIDHLRTFDLGMNIDQTLVIRAPNLDESDSILNSPFQSLKTELLRKPEVKMVARSNSIPGLSLHELSSTGTVRLGQDEKNRYTYYYFGIDADFISLMGMRLVGGRNFQNGIPNHDQIIINEEAMNKLGFSNVEEAVGTKLTFRTRWPGEPATIIGVVKNFYQRSPKEEHIPMIFPYATGTDYFSLRLISTNINETIASVKAVYEEVLPNNPFSYFFLDEKFNQQYQADAQFGKVVATFSVLAVFIACLGLFGLSSYTIVQRTKEIGIRKVLGASVGQIVHLLSQDFTKVIIIAALVAMPVAYFALEEWLSNYEVRIELSTSVFILPVFLILLLAFFTVSFQTLRTALTNPTKSLKQE
jgi:putative ABC transport system permease protein